MYMSQSREALSTVPNHTVSRVALASLPPPGGGFLGSGTHLHLSVPQHLPRSHVALVYLKMLWPLASSGRAAWSTCYLLGNPSGCASGPLRVVCSSAGSLLICVMLTGTSPLAPPGGKDEDGHAPALGGTSLSIPGLRGSRRGGWWEPASFQWQSAWLHHSGIQQMTVRHPCQALGPRDRTENGTTQKSLCYWCLSLTFFLSFFF